MEHLASYRAPSPDAGNHSFRYLGQYEDVETGLYYNRLRYYDPETGQYTSQDPIGLAGGGALHAYVADPLTQLDVFGLSEGSDILGRKLLNAGRTHGIIARDAQGTPKLNAKGKTYFPKSDFEAHHVIPHEVWRDNQQFFDDIGLGKKAPHARINRNGTRVHSPKGMNPKDAAANGVFLPKSAAIGNDLDFDIYHRGSHDTVSGDIRTEVEDISRRYDRGRGSITRTQARKEISALQKAERKRLSSRRGNGCVNLT